MAHRRREITEELSTGSDDVVTAEAFTMQTIRGQAKANALKMILEITFDDLGENFDE